MISACELCAKIAIENAMKDEAMRVAKMKVAKGFAEQVIGPILATLTEVPDHLEIGFRYHEPNGRGMFQGVSKWETGVTVRGNPVKHRNFTGELISNEGDYSLLDYEVLNQYLAEFGFQISTELKWITLTEYSTSTPDRGAYVDKLFLSMTCPLEDF